MGIKEKSGVKRETWEKSEAKVKVFLEEKLGLETDEITIERTHRIEKKEKGKRRTIIAKFLNYKQREKVLKKYKKLKLWEDHIHINEDFIEYTVENRRIYLNAQSKLEKEASLTKMFTTVLFGTKFDIFLLFKM